MGRAAAIEMARQGAAAVVIADIQSEAGQATAAAVSAEGAEGVFIKCDLRQSREMHDCIESVVARFGGLDVLHNNAGVIERAFTNDVDFDTLPEELWNVLFDVNVKAVWLLSRLAAPHLRQSKRSPAIVNAASTAGLTAYSHAIYGVTKAAVIQLTRTMAVRLAPEVRVNCYSPGTIATEMSHQASGQAAADPRLAQITASNLIPRRGSVEEVAKLVCFLASEDAGFTTGANYLIDGGTMAWRGLNL